MNKEKWKHRGKRITAVLVVCLMVVTILGNYVQAEEGQASPVEVSTWNELEAAFEQAKDGDVIKIMDAVTIPVATTFGSGEKRITLQRGSSQGRIAIDGSSDIEQISHVQNIVFDGAKIFGTAFLSTFSSVEISNSAFVNCYSYSSSGALCTVSTSNVTLNNCTFDNNKGNNGGHIIAGGKLILNGCTLKNGFASIRGGAICGVMSDVELTNCVIKGNTAVYQGGGIANADGGTVTVQNTKIFGNQAEQGNDVFTNANFQMDSTLETLQALYSDENITVNGWDSTSITNDEGEFSCMQLDYEVKQETQPADDSGGDSSGDEPTTETPTNTSDTGENGNQETPSDSSNAGNTGGSSTNSTDSSTNNSNNSNVTTSESNSTDTSDRSTSTTTNDNSDYRDYSEQSTVTNNDNRDQSTVNNTYYTTTPANEQGQQSSSTIVEVTPNVSATTSESISAGRTGESSQTQESTVQTVTSTAPNIKIDAKGVDCVFEYSESGGYNVSINSAESDPVQNTEQSSDRNTVSWLNVMQIILLAAIFVSVIWQRKPRRQGNYQE
jgi:hypothetical protein